MNDSLSLILHEGNAVALHAYMHDHPDFSNSDEAVSFITESISEKKTPLFEIVMDARTRPIGRTSNLYSPIIEALHKSDCELGRKLLRKGADPNDEAESYCPPIRIAARRKEAQRFALELIAAGADPTVRYEEDILHETVLHECTNVAVARIALDMGLDVNALSDEGTPLDVCGTPDVLFELIKRGGRHSEYGFNTAATYMRYRISVRMLEMAEAVYPSDKDCDIMRNAVTRLAIGYEHETQEIWDSIVKDYTKKGRAKAYDSLFRAAIASLEVEYAGRMDELVANIPEETVKKALEVLKNDGND